MKMSSFNNSSQMIGPEGLKLSGFGGGHCGVVRRKFSEDRNKTLPVGIYTKFPSWGHNSMPIPLTIATIV